MSDLSAAKPVPPRRYRLRRWTARGFWALVVIAIGFMIWALWYANNRGFTKKWRGMLVQELDRRGVHVQVSRLNLNPLKGLIARNVRILHPRDRDLVLATIDEVVLDLNYSNLIYGEPFINAVDLRQARLSLPIDPDDPTSRRLEVSDLNARVLLPPGSLLVPQADAMIYGLRVTASDCRVINLHTHRSGKPSGESVRRRTEALLRVEAAIRRLRELHPAGGNPVLDLRVHGDLAHPERFYAEAALRSGSFTFGDPAREIRSIDLIATYRDGRVSLRQCSITDPHGRLEASAIFPLKTREARFQLRSSLDLPGLLKAARQPWPGAELVWHDAPRIELEGVSTFPAAEGAEGASPHRQWSGRVDTGRFSARGIAFRKAAFAFAWDGERWFIRDGLLDHPSGTLGFKALYAGDLRFSIDSRINPKVLRPFLPEKRQTFLDEWEFESVPVIRFEGRSPDLTFREIKGRGHVALGRSRFRGQALESLVSDIEVDGQTIRFPGFRLQRSEGEATGSVEVNIGRQVVSLSGVRSSVTPVEVADWIDRKGELRHNIAPYRFGEKPPHLRIEGTVGFPRHEDQTRLRIDVVAPGVDYTFLKHELHFSDLSATLQIVEKRLEIAPLHATLFGGSFEGSTAVSLIRGQQDYTARIKVQAVDFPSITRLYFDYEASRGKLSGEYRFSGRGDAAGTIDGKGKLSIARGNVFAIPVFGPFSGILDEIIPGAGYDVAQNASATFSMKDGVIETEDMEVKGSGFSMFGAGKLFVLEDKIDFSIRVNAQGAAGVVLTPVSHLFEYVSDATLSKPVWRPKRLPKALFAR